MITPDLLRQLTFCGPHSPHLQLVFVNACHSQRVASVFLNAGIPHVVAVHSDSLVVDATATMFAKHFYLSLFSGQTVQTAFTVAKGFITTLASKKRAACCCAHLHEPTCKWTLSGSRHAHHNPNECCCKHDVLKFPHDESSKFVLLGGNPDNEHAHEVAIFQDIPAGEYEDYSKKYPCSIPSMHGQFIGRNLETHLLVKSVLENSVTACLGAPGIGKSSLIISVAHFIHSRRLFSDGVFYVDLEGQGLSTTSYAIARALSIPAGESDDEVFAELSNKNCLLVLDKVEELLDEDEGKTQTFFGKLISMAPDIKLLIASRRAPQVPNVKDYSLSLTELPHRTATELLCLLAPQCTSASAQRLASICDNLPLAIRVVGRALANARMTITSEQMIEYLANDEQKFHHIKELNKAGSKECIDRCIRSSFCHLEEPLRLAFMALGLFRGSFDIEAVYAVLSNPLISSQNSSDRQLRSTDDSSITTFSTTTTMLKGSNRSEKVQHLKDCDNASMKSLGSQLSSMDDYSMDNDGTMTDDSYDLLDMDSPEEQKSRDVFVFEAQEALHQLHMWSLVEYDSLTKRYRMHNLIQLFAQEEAIRMGDDNAEEDDSVDEECTFKKSSEFQLPQQQRIRLGKELLLTWKRRFVKHYCMVIAKAAHYYRFEGHLILFDKERPNIASAMNLARELAAQSIEQVRELQNVTYNELDSFNTSGNLDGFVERKDNEQALKAVKVSALVDTLLYTNLMVRCRFIFRTRENPSGRIDKYSSCLQLSRETRILLCECHHPENDPSVLLLDLLESKFDRNLDVLDRLPSFEHQQNQSIRSQTKFCSCVGIRELISMEALLLNELGYAYCDTTDWLAGEHHYLESLRLQREVLGRSEHAQVAEVLNQFGICLSARWGFLSRNIWLLQHAEKLLKGALCMRKRVLGEHHPDYATSLNNLANLYKSFAPNLKSSGCGPLLDGIHSLQDSRYHRKFGRERTLSHGSDVSSTCSETSTSTFGEEVNTSDTMSVNFAQNRQTSIKTHRFHKIEDMYRQSLKIREDTLGENHPQVAQSLNNLALLLSHKLQQFKKSKEQFDSEKLHDEILHLYKRALEIRRNILGFAHFETAATLNNLGNFKRLAEDFKGAEEDFVKALQICERFFNTQSPRVARIYHNLGRVYKDQERYADAVTAFESSLKIHQILFPDSREVGSCLEQLGKCLRAQGMEEEGLLKEEKGKKLRRDGAAPPEDIERRGVLQSSSSISTSSSSSASLGSTGSTSEILQPLQYFAKVQISEVLDYQTLYSRDFNFVGRLIGERAIFIKRIEAISYSQVRYCGPSMKYYHSNNNRSRTNQSTSRRPSMRLDENMKPEDSYFQISCAHEQMLDTAITLCNEHLGNIKAQWERFRGVAHNRHVHNKHYTSRFRQDQTGSTQTVSSVSISVKTGDPTVKSFLTAVKSQPPNSPTFLVSSSIAVTQNPGIPRSNPTTGTNHLHRHRRGGKTGWGQYSQSRTYKPDEAK